MRNEEDEQGWSSENEISVCTWLGFEPYLLYFNYFGIFGIWLKLLDTSEDFLVSVQRTSRACVIGQRRSWIFAYSLSHMPDVLSQVDNNCMLEQWTIPKKYTWPIFLPLLIIPNTTIQFSFHTILLGPELRIKRIWIHILYN